MLRYVRMLDRSCQKANSGRREHAGKGCVWDGTRWGVKLLDELLHPDVTAEDFRETQERLRAGRPVYLDGCLNKDTPWLV